MILVNRGIMKEAKAIGTCDSYSLLSHRSVTSRKDDLMVSLSNTPTTKPLIVTEITPEHRPLRVLVGCEYSGRVRDAFTALGHDAMSCDLLPSETPGRHYQGSVLDVLGDGWDIAVFHPPCTYLAVSGARWWAGREQEQEQAAAFFMALYNAPIPKVAVENPVGAMSKRFRPPDQYIQPWMFGHGETKKTGLWLKGLPPLQPTNIVAGREPVVHYASPGPDRWKIRSLTYQGIADAMAAQWGTR